MTNVSLFVTSDPNMSPPEDTTDAESQLVDATSLNSSDTVTNLDNSSISKVTVSPNVNGSTSSEHNDKVSFDDSDNVSPTVADKVEQCEEKDVSPPSVSTLQLSLGNDYLFDLD